MVWRSAGADVVVRVRINYYCSRSAEELAGVIDGNSQGYYATTVVVASLPAYI